MSQAEEKAEQRDFIVDEVPLAQSAAGPVAPPPAFPADDAPSPRDSARRAEAQGTQLPLPLDVDPEPAAEPAHVAEKRRSRRSKGFVPVTRDPDVARSYSDNVALDYAIARGLAQALGSLPPEELAALRAKVAKANLQNSRASSPRHPR